MSTHHLRLALGLGAFAFALSAAHAADEPDTRDNVTLDEVVVTATKRQELLQNVPASILVTSGEELINKNIENMDELYKLVPGFGTANYQNNFTISIRGVGTSSFSHAVQPSVGTVVDGVPVGRSGVSIFNFNDLERIEVLRGPQSTLFGMNSSGGVLNIVSKQPTNDTEGQFRIRYGTYNSIQIDGTVSGALVDDKVLGRLSYYSSKRDGFVDNLQTGEKENDDDQQGFTGKLAFLPKEGTRILLAADWVDRKYNCCLPTARVAHLDPVSQQFMGAIAGPGNNKVYGANRQGFGDRIKGASVQWDEEIGQHTLTSITAYREWSLTNDATGNFLPPPYELVPLVNYRLQQNQWSQEVRLTSRTDPKFDYVVGAFAFLQRLKSQTDIRIDLTPFIGFPLSAQNLGYDRTDNLNYALFGDVNYHLTDRLTFFAGLRRTEDEVEAEIVSLPKTPGYSGAVPGVVADKMQEGNWSWRVGSRFQATNEHMFYGTVSAGYKGPAFNTNTGTDTSQRVRGEESTNYEIGWKGEMLGNRLRGNIAAFYTDFKNFQADAIFDPDADGPFRPSFVLLNAGALETQGVELEIEALPVKDLTLSFRGAYIDATYKEFTGAPCYAGQTVALGCVTTLVPQQDLSGGRLPNTPELSWNAGFAWDIPFQQRPLTAFVRSDYSWRDTVQWDQLGNPEMIEDSYGLVGAAVGIRASDDHWRVTVYGENLTDEVHGSLSFSAPGLILGARLSQTLNWDYSRLYGVSFEYRF